MKMEQAIAGSETEPTLDPQWIEEQQDRLLGWELLRRAVFEHMDPLGPQEICDRIGEKKGYVWRVIQSAREKAAMDHTDFCEHDEH